MKRRTCLTHAMAAVGTLASLGMPLRVAAQANDAQAPATSAAKIIEALKSKDIVIDAAGQPREPGRQPQSLAINLQVQFGFDSAELLAPGKRQLDELALALNDQALLTGEYTLAGHTDQVGDADYNVRLSLARAMAVRAYLAGVHGVSADRLRTMGYGFSRLLDRANPSAAINRRVEVVRSFTLTLPSAPAGQLVPTPR